MFEWLELVLCFVLAGNSRKVTCCLSEAQSDFQVHDDAQNQRYYPQCHCGAHCVLFCEAVFYVSF